MQVVAGMDVVRRIEMVATNHEHEPLEACVITACGEISLDDAENSVST